MSSKILIMSGTSAIAQELAKLYVSKRNTLLIHGRNQKKLDQVVEMLSDLNSDAKIVGLPTIDLIHPKTKDLEHQNFESVYDSFYQAWFDEVVTKHGLPSHLIIASGGAADSASGTLEINAVSAIKCCENYIRKIREHAHNEKYKNKQFSITYMNSFLGERPDLWEKSVVYSQAKRCVKEYLGLIGNNTKDIRLRVQNAILGPIDTELLQKFYKTIHFHEMGPLERIYHNTAIFLLPMITTSVEKAAADLKKGIDSGSEEFFVPNLFAYMPYFLEAGPRLFRFVTNGLLFCVLFIPKYRDMVLSFIRNIFKAIGL